jgi:hypothetical protein
VGVLRREGVRVLRPDTKTPLTESALPTSVVAGGGRAESVELGADMRTQYFVVVELIVGRDNRWQLVAIKASPVDGPRSFVWHGDP